MIRYAYTVTLTTISRPLEDRLYTYHTRVIAAFSLTPRRRLKCIDAFTRDCDEPFDMIGYKMHCSFKVDIL